MGLALRKSKAEQLIATMIATMRLRSLVLVMMLLLSVSSYNPSLFSRRAVNLPVNSHKSRRASRRAFLATPAAVLFLPQTSSAVTPAPQPTSLRDILAARDANLLRKAFLNLPPPQQEYPPWLEGTWDCTSDFAGFEFPSKKVPKEVSPSLLVQCCTRKLVASQTQLTLSPSLRRTSSRRHSFVVS